MRPAPQTYYSFYSGMNSRLQTDNDSEGLPADAQQRCSWALVIASTQVTLGVW